MRACNFCIQGFSSPLKPISALKNAFIVGHGAPAFLGTSFVFYSCGDYTALSIKSLIRSTRKLVILELCHSNNIHRLGGVVLASICTLLKFCRSCLFFVLIFWLECDLWIVNKKSPRRPTELFIKLDICDLYVRWDTYKVDRHTRTNNTLLLGCTSFNNLRVSYCTSRIGLLST